MFKNVRSIVSFIDLLGCALGATIVLMLIFAKSKQQGGEIAYSAQDFIYLDIETNRPAAYLQLEFRTPDGKWIPFKLGSNAKTQYQSGFIQLSAKSEATPHSFYAWGPFYKMKPNGNGYDTSKTCYALYGTSPSKQKSWQLAATYFSDHTLNWSNDQITSKSAADLRAVKRLLDASLRIAITNRFGTVSLDTLATPGATHIYKLKTSESPSHE